MTLKDSRIRTPRLMVVSGDHVVTARCDQCGAYSNPREMAEVSPGGSKDAYAGTCQTCAKVAATFRSEAPNSVATNPKSTPGTPGGAGHSQVYRGAGGRG